VEPTFFNSQRYFFYVTGWFTDIIVKNKRISIV